MSTSKALRTGAFLLSAVFSQLAFSGEAPQSEIAGNWQSDSIGVVEIKPCKDNKSKFCGYLQSTTPEAIKEFKLRVDNTSQNIRGLMVMSNLEMNEAGTELSGGKFENSDSITAKNSTIKINCSADGILNVRAEIGWMSDDFKFQRVKPVTQLASVDKPKI